jgi:hypothetical protein
MSDYSNIINLPHHQSETHPQMSMHNRAAQFSPFAALTGYGEMVNERANDHNEAQDPRKNGSIVAMPEE